MGGEVVSEFWLRSAMWFAKASKREGKLAYFHLDYILQGHLPLLLK